MRDSRTTPPEVSIVVPIYNELENLPDLVERIHGAMATQPLSFELIAVDDGSSDGSAARLRELAAGRPWLRAVCLVRNYGQSAALQAGFDRVRGRYVVTLDADLQNEPQDIPLLLQRLETDPEVDMVSGWRHQRQDKALSRRLPSMLANRLISRSTGVHLHDYGCALKAYRRPIIDRTFRVILDLMLIVFFMRYRHRPLHAFGGMGLWLATPGLLMLAWLAGLKLLGHDVGGRPLLITGVMLLLMGLQLIVAGLVGEMLIRIYHEGRGQPQFYAHEHDPLAETAPSTTPPPAPLA